MKIRQMKMNKKAMFFTLLAISILSLFLVSYTLYSVVQNREPINKRIETMNNFVFSVEQDLPRQLYVSGFRVIFLLEKNILDTGNYLTNLNSTLKELFFDGTLYGAHQPLMSGANFSGIQDSFDREADKINANVILTNPALTVSQEDPWRIKFALGADLLIEDDADLALWNKTIFAVTYVPIENFIDPIYFVNTAGAVPNKINRTIYEPFATGTDVSNLTLHVENSMYIASTSAPSFLDRLEGDTTSSENGIESLVYRPDIPGPKDKSVVDHVYFSGQNPASRNIQGMPFWFKLDDSSLARYGVGHLAS